MFKKLRLIWGVLRGKPIIYKVHFKDAYLDIQNAAMVVDCNFVGDTTVQGVHFAHSYGG